MLFDTDVLKMDVSFVVRVCGMLVCSKRMKCLHVWHRSVLILSLFIFLMSGQKTHSAPSMPLTRSLFFPFPMAA